MLAIFVARPLATLILDAVNQLSVECVHDTVIDHQAALTERPDESATATPGLRDSSCWRSPSSSGPWLLWCELIVRAVVLTLAARARAGHRAPRHVSGRTSPRLASRRDVPGRRGEQVLHRDHAVARTRRTARAARRPQVITGAVTLILATFSPFLLLKVIPFVETAGAAQPRGRAGAAHQDR